MKKIQSILLLLLISASFSAISQPLVSSISCLPFAGGFICDASPIGLNNEYSYSWRSTASDLASSCGGEFVCHEGCSNGRFTGNVTVDVTVTDNATGFSDTASKLLSCQFNGGGFGF